MKKNKKILLTAATVATLSLAACNSYTDRASYNRNYDRSDYTDFGYNHASRGRIKGDYGTDYDTGYGYNGGIANYNRTNYNNGVANNRASRTNTDAHLNFVSDHGFENVVNAKGTTAYRSYRLDSKVATDNDIFHSWRHAWVDPLDYMDKDIDLYRYNGNIDGEQRTIHILSHNGKPIGGYHFGRGETAEQGVMLRRDGFASRAINDFRGAWDKMFDIRG